MQLQVLGTSPVAPVKSGIYGGHQLTLAGSHDRIEQRLAVQQYLQHALPQSLFGD
jgi:hypothetical protein